MLEAPNLLNDFLYSTLRGSLERAPQMRLKVLASILSVAPL